MTTYNKTQLTPEKEFERHIYHRDQFAHYLRWTHVLKNAKIGMKILDVGCGTGELFEVFYRNKFKPSRYLGIDIRKKIIEKNNEKWLKNGAEFKTIDIALAGSMDDLGNDWNIICSFELAEHIMKKNVVHLLQNIYNCCSDNTIVMISTPCYDGVNCADNHIINGEIGEMTFEEFKEKLEVNFIIENVYGTFASIKDYKKHLNNWPGLENIYKHLHDYYDSNILSCLIAPLFPEQSRNCLWKLRKK